MIDRAHHISTNICHFVSHPFTSTKKKKIHTLKIRSDNTQLSQLDSPEGPTTTANISWPLLSSMPSASIPSNPAHSQASRAGYCTLKVTHTHTQRAGAILETPPSFPQRPPPSAGQDRQPDPQDLDFSTPPSGVTIPIPTDRHTSPFWPPNLPTCLPV